jgi:hypothetical protein
MKFVLLIISFLAVLFLGSTLCAYLQKIELYPLRLYHQRTLSIIYKTKSMKWLKKIFHKHSFAIKDVVNLKVEPKCTCGKTLSELCKERGIKLSK